MKQTIDTYKLTSMEEPTDEVLSQLMREAAEDARVSNEEATERYFRQMMVEAQKAVDALLDQGAINNDTIEKWSKEHMRTPYRYETNRP